MSPLTVRLFGKLSIHRDDQPVQGLEARKVQELLSYLLLNRGRPQPRESLAAVLWGESPTVQSRKYLRQGLWQLQAGLNSPAGAAVLEVNNDWVQVSSRADLILDVADFERLVAVVRSNARSELREEDTRALQEAVALYHGDLLEGWYADWCLFERERLQQLYLAVLDTLMLHCERSNTFEQGCAYAEILFRYDPARERTHRQVMRLRYLAGDRTGALRQYDRCVAALHEELGVAPARGTTLLYQQIRDDRFDPEGGNASVAATATTMSPLTELLLSRLRHVRQTIADLERQIQHDLDAVEWLSHHRG